MSRSFALGFAPVLCAVSPLLAQSYAPPPPSAAYADPNDQMQNGDDRADAAPQAPRYEQRPDAPPPGYYRQAPQTQAPYDYYQPEPQRRPAYADNNSTAPRAPYARYDYGRQPDYYGPQPDYGRRPVYQQPQRAPTPRPEAEQPVAQTVAPVAAPAVAAPAPTPVAAVDPLDQAMWDAAKRANGVQGYTVYLDRYPSGGHSQEAEAAIDQLQQELQPAEQAATQENGAPAIAKAAAVAAAPIKLASAPAVLPTIKGLPMKAVETAAVPVAPAASIDAAPVKPVITAALPVAAQPAAFMCRPAFQGAVPYDQADSAEIAAYLQATRVNSVAAYQTYLAAYPHGVFTGEVQDVVAARQGRTSQLAAAGLTPAAAHARAKVTLTAADYPAVALRDGQQGTAVASWEVAEDGCVESCKIDRSSGSSALDAATCNVITERGRYDPAFGAQGKPVRATETAQLTWNLPQH